MPLIHVMYVCKRQEDRITLVTGILNGWTRDSDKGNFNRNHTVFGYLYEYTA